MNSIRPFRNIKRRLSREISVGKVRVGGENPISVQSMTNTLTTDINKTINQLAGEWVLINANEMHCPVDVTGTRKSISLQHRFKFTETEQTWIDSHIIE